MLLLCYYTYSCRIRASLGLINNPLSSTASSLSEAWQPDAVAAAVAKIEATQKALAVNTNNVKSVQITMYNFGSPRLGNAVFSKEYNRLLPDSFRVEVDGDVVTGVPKGSYKHVGTNVTVDALGAGSIIIDPSYLEMRLRTRTKAHVSVHSLIVYRQGLLGVRAAAEFMQDHAKDRSSSMDPYDAVKLAISAGPLKIWKMLGGAEEVPASASANSRAKSSERIPHNATAVDRPHTRAQQEADDMLLQDIENTVPIAVLPRMTTYTGAAGVGPTGGAAAGAGSERKDALHLEHDNQINQELFASIRAQQALLGANKLTPLMQRSIKMFRFRGRDKEEVATGVANGNPLHQSSAINDGLSRDQLGTLAPGNGANSENSIAEI